MNKDRKLAGRIALWIIGSALWGGATSYVASSFATDFGVFLAVIFGVGYSLPFFFAIAILFRLCKRSFKPYGTLFLAFLAGSILLQYLYAPPDRTFTIPASDQKAITENYVLCTGVPQEKFTVIVEPVYKKAFHSFRKETYRFHIVMDDGKRRILSTYNIDKTDLEIKCEYRQFGEPLITKSRKIQALGGK